jgi:hypothetical protein
LTRLALGKPAEQGMLDHKLMSVLLFLYVGSGLLLILISLPLLWGRIPPNPVYGFRVRATLENPAIWYPANKFAAKRLIWTGIVVAGAALVLYAIPELSINGYALGCLAVLMIALTFTLVQSFLYLRTLTRSGSKD